MKEILEFRDKPIGETICLVYDKRKRSYVEFWFRDEQAAEYFCQGTGIIDYTIYTFRKEKK